MEIKGYSDLWKAIIRPPRNDDYDDAELGPPEFQIKGRRFKRTDVDLVNDRELTIKCTHYEPIDSQRPCKELPCVLYLHGNASSRTEAMPAVKLLLPEDITVFTLDFSGSGKSDGEYISLGWYERDDVATAVEYLRDLGTVATIGLWGRSMGAVTALLHSDRDPSIAGIVCDSAFSDLKKLSSQLAKKYTKMPGFVVSMGTKFIAKSVKDRAKFQLAKVKPIDHIDKAFVPILFGHAKEDDFILPSHSEELHEKYAGDKNYISFEGDHNSTRPAFFDDSVVIFFINSLQVHNIVPQDKKHFDAPPSSVPDFDVSDGFAFDDDMDQYYNGGFGQDVSEEDMIKMAMEESLKSAGMESHPDPSAPEEAKQPEQTEDEFLADVFGLNDGDK
eukprot:CAMPEP_0197004600 /NCGR_PEP_ID=MMETSP1380-20130617/23854_1 /TAXON_ID=5936 /ORGANISM="Euplotes crassus, Strain CT5" /LENGTH=387 /DNA_ID=CAMNT_0042423445 /DNA_START=27 /DNA_END=1191 /DNA_ORIENTATION=+